MRFLQDSHGGDLCARYDFSINVSPLGMSRRVRRAIVSSLKGVDRYPDPYCGKLREAISVKEGIPTECILAGNGAAELIYAYAAYHAGDKAYILAPTFTEYAAAFEAYNGEVEYVYEDIGETRLKSSDTVFVCVPNNPDGILPSRSRLWGLIESCRAAGATLFLDACFYDFTTGAPYLLKELLSYENVFVLQAFTKSYALAGLRLGYLMGKAETLQKISGFVQPWSVSALAQAAGIAAAGDTKYLNRLRVVVQKEREYLMSGLKDLGYLPYPSCANFLLFEGEQDLAVCLRKRGIAIRGCDDFVGLVAGKDKKFFRIAVRTHRENSILLKALREVKR